MNTQYEKYLHQKSHHYPFIVIFVLLFWLFFISGNCQFSLHFYSIVIFHSFTLFLFESQCYRQKPLSAGSLSKCHRRLKLILSEARKQERFLDLPHSRSICELKVPRTWAFLGCFPRPLAGSWIQSAVTST